MGFNTAIARMQQKTPLSVVIIALNAASQIEACLKSAAFADEIVVVDSGSRDDTREIALKYGARVLHQDWLGFGRQKQFAVEQASHDWVLCLDADERVSDPLRASIVETLQAPRFRAYRMPRCNRFMGRWLRHGEGYPDWSLRLFDRRVANWSEDEVHEKVLTLHRWAACRAICCMSRRKVSPPTWKNRTAIPVCRRKSLSGEENGLRSDGWWPVRCSGS